MSNEQILKKAKKHYLKHHSSFIVVILRSLMHKACVNCGKPLKTLEESAEHWEKALKKDSEKERE